MSDPDRQSSAQEELVKFHANLKETVLVRDLDTQIFFELLRQISLLVSAFPQLEREAFSLLEVAFTARQQELERKVPGGVVEQFINRLDSPTMERLIVDYQQRHNQETSHLPGTVANWLGRIRGFYTQEHRQSAINFVHLVLESTDYNDFKEGYRNIFDATPRNFGESSYEVTKAVFEEEIAKLLHKK
jgi:hypothetical protein